MRLAFRTVLAASSLAAGVFALATVAANLAASRTVVSARASAPGPTGFGERDLLPGPRVHPTERGFHVYPGTVPADLLSGGPPPRPSPAPDFGMPALPMPRDLFVPQQDVDAARRHFFAFTRAVYSSGGGGFGRRGFRRGGGSWSTDWPKSDQQFIYVFDIRVGIDAYDYPFALQLDDPNLRRFPFLYSLEVGRMALYPSEIEGLRSYLLAGGFLVVDDFWGVNEWANFEWEMQQVFPEYSIVEMSLDHEIFHTFYDITEVLQVPNVNNACYGGSYSENGGTIPHVRGIFDEKGRLMVIINFNSDLGDAWEWMEQACYPLDRSTYAAQMGMNFIVYSMSH